MLPAHNFYDLFRVKTVSHSPSFVGFTELGVGSTGYVKGGGGVLLSATSGTFNFNFLLLEICLPSNLSHLFAASFSVFQRFKCRNENVFGFPSLSLSLTHSLSV